MTKSRKITNSFLIGIFVLFGFVLTGLAIIWFGTSKLLRESSYYVTYFVGSVEGISKGNPVKYLGVPVGSIYDVRVAPDGRMIEIIIVMEKIIPVSDSLRVKIEFSGLTGGKFLQLFYALDSSILNWHPKLTFNPPFRVIPSAPSGIETLEAGLRQTLEKVTEFKFGEVSTQIVASLKSAKSFLENEELWSSIQNLKYTTERLKSISEKADASNLINILEESAYNLKETISKLEIFSDSLNFELQNAQISNKVASVFKQADSVITTAKKIGRHAELSLYSLDELIRNLKTTNLLVQNLIREYLQNPGMLLFSEPPPVEQ
ncbi:MAG: MlaD family protein [Candidatus Kapaibacteriales bacterium]